MIFDILNKLCNAPGVAGEERAAASVACDMLKKYAADATADNFGNVTGSIKAADNLPLLLLDAHIDEIGLVVTFIDEKGFVKVGAAGGVDRRVLPAQTVTLWGETPIKGVICSAPPHLKTGSDDKAVKIDDVVIDTGYSKENLEKKLSLGDKITIDNSFEKLLNNRVCGRALDNRAGVASILFALDLIGGKKLKYNLAINFSSQEELGCRGAAITSYNFNPDYAIVVDVSYGNAPDCDPIKTGKIGGGAMIGIAPSLDRAMYTELKELAENNKISWQTEVMSGKTGTNACAISVSRGGVRTALLSIPERNMHMPVETVDTCDIEAVAKLIAAYVTEVD